MSKQIKQLTPEQQQEQAESEAAEKALREDRLNETRKAVMEFLERYAYIVTGATGGVIDMGEFSRTGQFAVVTVTTFHERFSGIIGYIVGNGGKLEPMPVTKIWFASPDRRNYDKTVFSPNCKHVDDNVLNLWRGFSPDVAPVEDRPVVDERTGVEYRRWKSIDYHLKHVICGDDEQAYTCLLDWLAQMMQQPEKRPGFGVFMQSDKEGAGKGRFADDLLGMLVGTHNHKVVNDADELLGDIGNADLANKIVIFCDESFFAGDPRVARKLKNFMTRKKFRVRPLYVNPFEVDCLHRVVAATNDFHFLRASDSARRYLVLKVSDKHVGDKEYNDALDKQFPLELPYFKYHLLHRDITNFNRWMPFVTPFLREQADMSKDGYREWFDMSLDAGRFTYFASDRDAIDGEREVTVCDLRSPERPLLGNKKLMRKSYADYCRRNRLSHQINETSIGIYMLHRGARDHEVRRKDEDRHWYDMSAFAITDGTSDPDPERKISTPQGVEQGMEEGVEA